MVAPTWICATTKYFVAFYGSNGGALPGNAAPFYGESSFIAVEYIEKKKKKDLLLQILVCHRQLYLLSRFNVNMVSGDGAY